MSVIRPLVAALVGALMHAIGMALGPGYDLGYASLAGVAVLIAAVVGSWGASGSPARAARTTPFIGLVALVALPLWWTGLPTVLGVAAVELGLEARLRTDDTSGASAVGLVAGTLAVVASFVSCLLG